MAREAKAGNHEMDEKKMHSFLTIIKKGSIMMVEQGRAPRSSRGGNRKKVKTDA